MQTFLVRAYVTGFGRADARRASETYFVEGRLADLDHRLTRIPTAIASSALTRMAYETMPRMFAFDVNPAGEITIRLPRDKESRRDYPRAAASDVAKLAQLLELAERRRKAEVRLRIERKLSMPALEKVAG